MNEDKKVTPGAQFTSKWSGVTLIDLPVESADIGSEHYLASKDGSIYGPYRVAWHGDPQPNTMVTAVVYKVSPDGAAVTKRKPLTKAELEQQVAQLAAQLAKIQAAQAPAKSK